MHRVGVKAKQTGRANFQLPGDKTIRWLTIRGMKWQDFHHIIQREILFSAVQRLIILHLGGKNHIIIACINIEE